MNRKTYGIPAKRFSLIIRVGITLVILFSAISQALAAYRFSRPITNNGGPIVQWHLWGILSGNIVHRGIDFANPIGTHVYAVASGKVTDLKEDCGDHECTWGSYVVIQHDQRHYDRVHGVNAYVYTMYIHLNENSVQPETIGTHVNAGDWIGDVDTSGTGVGTWGSHLHFQTVINSLPDLRIWPTNELDSENRSRNPEIWLAPFNGATGTVIGKVTDMYGTPVGNQYVTGLEKNSNWNYQANLTYNQAFLNPDDILVENWATTDVTPGTYDMSVNYQLFAEDVVVEANRVTYVGLYPSWLPNVRNIAPWSSAVAIFNSSATHTANVNSTKFSSSGTVQEQREDDYVWPSDRLKTWLASNSDGSAIVVPSQKSQTVLITEHFSLGYSFADNATSARDLANPGWGEIGTTLFAPSILKNYYSWNSTMYLMNAGYQTANVTIRYYNSSGSQIGSTTTANIVPFGSLTTSFGQGEPNTYYTARVSSNQPLAGVVRQYSGGVFETYNLFSKGGYSAYAPLIMDNYYGWNTSVNIQNTTGATAHVYVTYYNQDGTVAYTKPVFTLPAYSSATYYSPNEPLPPGFQMGAATITASQPVALVVNQSAAPGGSLTRGLSYNGPLSGSSTVIAPDVRNHYPVYGQWVTSINVLNVGSIPTTVTVNFQGYSCSAAINPNGMYSFYMPNCGGLGGTTVEGSAVITSNNGQPITVAVNQSWHTAPPNADYAFSYTGINK